MEPFGKKRASASEAVSQPIPPRRRLLPGGHLSPPATASQDPSEAIGRAHPKGWRAWLGLPGQRYILGPARSGVIVGTTESGIDNTLYRLAYNAAVQGWKVFFFDAQGSQEHAATFLATMRQAGREHIHAFPYEPYAGWKGTKESIVHRLLQAAPFHEQTAHYLATVGLTEAVSQDGMLQMSQVAARLKQMSQKRHRLTTTLGQFFQTLPSTHLSTLPLRYAALSTHAGQHLDGYWSVDNTDAAYFAFNSWGRPQEARHLARFLLADLASFLTERVDEQPPVLLLIKHPERLLSTERLPRLFAQMEQVHGTLFLASRSVTDFGEATRGVLNNASTLLVHRSQSEMPFEPYVLLPATHPFFTGAVQTQSDHECFVIEQGWATQVWVDPVDLDASAMADAHESLSSPPFDPFPYGFDSFMREPVTGEEPLEDLVSLIFSKNGIDEANFLFTPELEPTGHQKGSSRSKSVRNAVALEQKANQEEQSKPVRRRRSRSRTRKEKMDGNHQQKSSPSLFESPPPNGDE